MLKPAELYTHTHTQLKRCRDFLCKLCLGAVLIFTPIFSFSATLPSGYTQLEYIRSNGPNNYIDTGYTPAAEKTRVVAKVDFLGTIDNKVFSAGTYGQDLYQLQRLNADDHNNKIRVYYYSTSGAGDYDTSASFVTANNPVYIDFDKNVVKINDNAVVTFTATSHTASTPLKILYDSVGNSINLYYFKIYDNDNLVRDFIPAKRNSDGVVGLYDTVNGVFYTNSGTGSFIAGPAVSDEPSCEYTRLEYIESSGTQYMVLGNNVYLQTGSIIEVDYQITADNPNQPEGLHAIYGNRSNSWPNSFFSFYTSIRIKRDVFLYDSFNYGAYDSNIDTTRHVIRQESEKFYKDGNLIYTSPISDFTNDSRVWLFSQCGSTNLHIVGRIYSAKIWSDGTNMSFNGIPVKRNSDGALGMYDTVTNTFFTNAGTGTFIAGPTITSGNNCSATISITWGGLAEPDASGTCTYGGTFTAPNAAPTAPSGLKFLGWRPIGQ